MLIHNPIRMKTIIFSILFFSLPLISMGQGLAGEYALSRDGAEVVFQIQDAGPNRLTGMMIDSDSTLYQLQAIVDQGNARGSLANSQSVLYFEAYREGDQLFMTIMPVDAYNQPDYLNASDFVLSRRERIKPPLEQARKTTPEGAAANQPLPQPKAGAGGVWEGVFNGEINGAATRLSFQRYGNQLTGEIDAAGYKYNLEGAINGPDCWGEVLDPQTQGKMKFSGVLDGDVVVLSFSAEQGPFQMNFLREGATALPGNWYYASSPVFGESGQPKELLLLLHTDNTFHYGNAKAVRANPEGKGVGHGQWQTQKNQLLINQGKGWQNFAAYEVKGNSLFLKFSSGDIQEWKRVDK